MLEIDRGESIGFTQFDPRTEQALISRGFEIVELEGKPIEELLEEHDIHLWDRYADDFLHSQIRYQGSSHFSQVAVNPVNPAWPNTEAKGLYPQEDHLASVVMMDLKSGMELPEQGFIAQTGELADVVAIVARLREIGFPIWRMYDGRI